MDNCIEAHSLSSMIMSASAFFAGMGFRTAIEYMKVRLQRGQR